VTDPILGSGADLAERAMDFAWDANPLEKVLVLPCPVVDSGRCFFMRERFCVSTNWAF
jgi:hypothetical protein